MTIAQPTIPYSNPTTSRAAARTCRTADHDRDRIAGYLLTRKDGATRAEIEHALQMDGNTIRPRVWELLGNCARFLERGGDAVLVERGTREWGGHKASRVLMHKKNT